MHLSLPNQLRIVAGLFLLTALVGAGTVIHLQNGMRADGRVVNFAGIVRGGTQRLVKLELAGRPSDKLVGRLEKIVKGLIQGDGELDLPRASDRAFVGRMNEVEAAWGQLKAKVMVARADATARPALLEASEAFFETTDRAVSSAEGFAVHKVRRLRNTQYAIVLVTLALALFVSLRLVRAILRSTREVVDILTLGAAENTDMASQVARASQSLAAGCSEQAASLQETSASLEQIASMNRRNCNHSREARISATDTLSAAEAGVVGMRELASAMQAIRASNESVASMMSSIDDIAAQTNLLALNAAVEAARAGESGAGFAVVADEVRALAKRSSHSAKETAERVKETLERTRSGSDLSGRVEKALESILARVRDMDQAVQRIALATEEQSQGVAQVNQAVVQMDQVTQASAAMAEETASASESLRDQAGKLRTGVIMLSKWIGGASGGGQDDRGSEPVVRSGYGSSHASPQRRLALVGAGSAPGN